MIDKLKKLIMFIAIIFGVTLFAAEETKAPNEIIKDNPKKEVTTVESMKVRDHATMSLSVTKSKPEEIMGSLSEDGKLSVFIYKKQARKMARSASTKDINISNFKLKAYTNTKNDKPMVLRARSANNGKNMAQNLSAETIRSMMNSGESSKEKKINIVEDTPEYVRLEVEDVQKNEKVYISVMDGDSVVKSYRIGDVSIKASNSFCSGSPISKTYTKSDATIITGVDEVNGGFVLNSGLTSGANGNFQVDKLRYVGSGIVKVGNQNNPNIKVKIEDDYFPNFSIGMGLTMALKIENVDVSTTIDKYKITTDSNGAIEASVGYIPLGDTNGAYKYWLKTRIKNSEIGSVYADSVWYSKFNNLQDIYSNKGCDKYTTFKRNIEEVAIRLWANAGNRIGVYETKNYGWRLGKEENYTISGSQNIKLALKSGNVTFNKTLPASVGTEINLNTEIGSDKYNKYSLSFMKKQLTQDRGLFRGNGEKLSSGSSFEISGTDNKNNKVKVTVNQMDGKYITLKLVPTQLNSTDKFTFTLQQKFNTHILRQVTYNITLQKTNPLGKLHYNIDSRIEGSYGEWIDKNGNVKDKTGNIHNVLPEMVGAWVDNEDQTVANKAINDVVNINGKSGDQLGNDTNKKYKYLQNSGNNKLALPYNVQGSRYTSSGILANKQDLDEDITQNKTVTNSFLLKDGSNTFWSGTMTENYIGNKQPNNSSGTIDFSSATKDTEYVFSPGTSNPSAGNPAIQLKTTTSLNAKGRLTKNENKNIATRIVVEAVTKDRNSTPQTITRADVKAGTRVEPKPIPALENKIAIGIDANGGLILKRLSNAGLSGNTKRVKISYYYSGATNKDGVKLGEFTLDITMRENVKPLRNINIEMDPRIKNTIKNEVAGSYSWITLDKRFGKWDNTTKVASAGIIYVDGVYTDGSITIKNTMSVNETPLSNSDGYDKYRGNGSNRDDIVFKTNTILADFDSSSNLMISPAKDTTYNVKYLGNDETRYSSTIKTTYAAEPKSNYESNKGYIGSGELTLTGQDKTGVEYTLVEPNGSTTGKYLNLNKHTGTFPKMYGLVKGQTGIEIATGYKMFIDNSKVGEAEFGSQNNGIETKDQALKVKLVKNRNDGRNVLVTKLKDDNFNKNIKIEYYVNDTKLGEYNLTVSNTRTIKDIGTLTTTIDPRLGKLTEEWITLGDYSGGNDLANLTPNKYLGLIADTTNTFNEQRTINSIIKVSKEQTQYQHIPDNGNGYKRYGTSNNPSVAIYKVATDPNIINTGVIQNEDNFARKVKDKETVTFEFKAGNDLYYSFEHTLNQANSPATKPNKFTPNDGYIGSANVDLSGKDLDTPYTLVENSATNNEINMEQVDGWLPTFGGIVSGYSDTVIVDHYKINNSNSIYFNNNSGKDLGNFSIKLIKPDTVNNKKNIIITKKNDNTYEAPVEVKIEYYHSSGIKLGEFTLTVTNTRTEKDLGESTVNIDPRIVQVSDDYSWIDLKNGDMFQLTTGTKAGNYTDFIGIPSAFPNAQNHSSYNEFNLEYVIELNNSTLLTRDFYTYNGTDYTILPGNNEAGIPTNIKLKDFVKVDNSTKLIISKFAVTSSEHKKNNNFLISGKNGNQEVSFSGNIKEVYLDKNGREITSSTINKDQNIFSGNGTLNLAPAEVGTPYWFDKTKPTNSELQGNGDGDNKVVLKLGSKPDSLNAAGIIPKSKNKRVANKMVLTVNKKEETVNLNGKNLEKELSIGEGKVKIAIDSEGRLEVTKIQEGNIPSTPIEIKYYYKPSTSIATNEIHLGTFTLTIENPIITSDTKVTVKIDKRFESFNKYNWLFNNGDVSSDIRPAPTDKIQEFSNFFKYNGSLKVVQGTIIKDLGMTGREVKNHNNLKAEYGYYQLSGETTSKGEGAIPRTGDMSKLNDLITVSKGNDPNDLRSLENEFSLLFTDSTNGNKYKIYRGNLKEEIVGDGKTDGIGTINLNDMEDDVAYEFKKENYSSIDSTATGEGAGNKSLEMTNVKVENSAIQPLPNGKAVPEIKNIVIANKIIVNNQEADANKKTVTVDGVEFGIGVNGGLTVKKLPNITFNESKTYTIEISYISGASGLNKIVLSNFTLTIVGNEFELDPDDQALDFGKMFYDSRDGGVTHETRVKTFTVKNQNNKNITFSVKANNSKMISTSDPQNEVQLINIGVKKKSNTSFELGATAVLNKDTKPGSYQGTIEVIVDIITPSNP